MNCDRIAPFYRLFEYVAFGVALEERRRHFLNQTTKSRRALIIGDGDGRFTAGLVQINPVLKIDYLELSEKMIEQARRRIRSNRVSYRQTNALTATLAPGSYDLVVTHFFLDCLSNTECKQLIAKVAAATTPDATWIVSEFCQPSAGWHALHAWVWLSAMYFFFRLATNLQTTRLPDYASSLAENGFRRVDRFEARAGLIVSELWQS